MVAITVDPRTGFAKLGERKLPRCDGAGDAFKAGGGYWQAPDESWRLFIAGVGIGDLTTHEVVEHDDGTISVNPSIAARCGTGMFEESSGIHGTLWHGIWRDG